MAVKGSVAKQKLENKLALTFGDDYIGNIGGKVYLWVDDGGQKVQIALAMTCPKTQVETPNKTKDITDWDWSDEAPAPEPPKKAEISQEELDSIAEMMKKFGL